MNIIRNYLKKLKKKDNLYKFNFLNIYNNLNIKNIEILYPLNINKKIENFKIVKIKKINYIFFNQNIFFKKFNLLNKKKTTYFYLLFKMNINKKLKWKFLDFFILNFFYNYNYFIKKNLQFKIKNNKLTYNVLNWHNFYKKLLKYNFKLKYSINFILTNNNINIKKKYYYFFFKNLKLIN